MSLATMSSQTSKPPQALRFLHKKFKHILLSSHTSQNTAKLPNVCLITVKVSEKKKIVRCWKTSLQILNCPLLTATHNFVIVLVTVKANLLKESI